MEKSLFTNLSYDKFIEYTKELDIDKILHGYCDDPGSIKSEESSKYCFSAEHMKLIKYEWNKVIDNCCIKALQKNKNNTERVKELNSFPALQVLDRLYKSVYFATRNSLRTLYNNTSNLTDLTPLYNTQFLPGSNKYDTKEKDRYDKVRSLYRYLFSTKKYLDDIMNSEDVKANLEILYSIYLLYAIDSIDIETRKRFYSEMMKIVNQVILLAYEDNLLYYLMYHKLEKSELFSKRSWWSKLNLKLRTLLSAIMS